jgi:CRISPR/Cas system-associated protein Cas10 (large subunit of type III CRISPR-Cas system)
MSRSDVDHFTAHQRYFTDREIEKHCEFCGNRVLFGNMAKLCKENDVPSVIGVKEMVCESCKFPLDFNSFVLDQGSAASESKQHRKIHSS